MLDLEDEPGAVHVVMSSVVTWTVEEIFDWTPVVIVGPRAARRQYNTVMEVNTWNNTKTQLLIW